MRLHILSDLHLEFAPFVPPATNADAVILAGDISTGQNGLKWAMAAFPDRPVIYVLGNHEFYGQKLQKLIRKLHEAARGSNIHVLEEECVTLEDVTFLGTTLWTDFALNGDPVMSEVVAQTSMSDYRRIRTLLGYGLLKPSDTRQIHMRSRRWLEEQTLALTGRKLVVVTHHAPSIKSIPSVYEGDPCNPAFASELAPFVEQSGVRLWIHGHIHSPSDYKLGRTRILANPRGYPTESKLGFNPALLVEV